MWRILVGSLTFSIVLGCTSKPSTPKFSVALVTDGPVRERGWNQAGYEALGLIQQQIGCQVTAFASTSENRESVLRQVAERGFNLVIEHQTKWTDSSDRIARDFPKVQFLRMSESSQSGPVGHFYFNQHQAYYLAGVAARELSKRKRIGFITRDDSGANLFAAIFSTTPAQVMGMLPSNDSGEAARLATENAIKAGADVIIHDLVSGQSGVTEACRAKRILIIGLSLDSSDQSDLDFASVVIHPGPVFLDIARRVKSGTYKPGCEGFGFKEGGVSFVVNPSLRYLLPDEKVAKLRRLEQDIREGRVDPADSSSILKGERAK